MKYFIFSTLFLTPLAAFAAPGIPHQLYGSIEGGAGETLSAYIDGVVVGSTTVSGTNTFGSSTNLFFIEDPNDTHTGKTISFMAGTSSIVETISFVSGGLSELSLTFGTSESSQVQETASSGGGSFALFPENEEEQQEEVQVVVTSSSGGSGSQGIPGDLNGDGVVDIKDFNFIAVYWGTPRGDLTGDGTTNADDSVQLLLYWN